MGARVSSAGCFHKSYTPRSREIGAAGNRKDEPSLQSDTSPRKICSDERRPKPGPFWRHRYDRSRGLGDGPELRSRLVVERIAGRFWRARTQTTDRVCPRLPHSSSAPYAPPVWL